MQIFFSAVFQTLKTTPITLSVDQMPSRALLVKIALNLTNIIIKGWGKPAGLYKPVAHIVCLLLCKPGNARHL